MTVPRSLRIAALLTAAQAAGLVGWGLFELLRSVVGHPNDRGTAVFLGLIVIGWGTFIGFVCRGLLRRQRWAQTPTYLEHSFAVVIAVFQIATLPGLAVPLIVVAAAALVAVSWPDAREALGGI